MMDGGGQPMKRVDRGTTPPLPPAHGLGRTCSGDAVIDNRLLQSRGGEGRWVGFAGRTYGRKTRGKGKGWG